MNTCARKGCEETFYKKTHNQKYHDDECCRLATNERIMQKYYAKRDQRSGKTRYCSSCEGKLSRYNDGTICNSCRTKKEVAANTSAVNFLLSVVSPT